MIFASILAGIWLVGAGSAYLFCRDLARSNRPKGRFMTKPGGRAGLLADYAEALGWVVSYPEPIEGMTQVICSRPTGSTPESGAIVSLRARWYVEPDGRLVAAWATADRYGRPPIEMIVPTEWTAALERWAPKVEVAS